MISNEQRLSTNQDGDSNLEHNLSTSESTLDHPDGDENPYIFRSKYYICRIATGVVLFISISMIVGILVVYFTSPKQSGAVCTMMMTSINQNSSNKDSGPKAIVVYDFNNDGILDIVVANSATNNIGIFLGHGNNSFANQVIYSTGMNSNPTSIAIGDFNNDGRTDLVVTNFGSHTIGLLLGNGNGTFQQQITYFTGSSRPLYVAVGDFNSDARLDLVVANYGTNIIDILFGYGNASFSNYVQLSATYDALPFSVGIGDYNNDNKSDIAVANYGTHTITIFLGDGNGTFPVQRTFSVGIGSHPYAIAVADINYDKKLDIVVVNYGTSDVSVLFGYGNGTFEMRARYSTGMNSKPMSVIIGDFNHDGRVDIVVSNNGTSNVGVFLGFGDGSFTNQTIFSTGSSSQPYSIAGGDFNGDDRLDIAIVNYGTNNVGILLAYANATFTSQTIYSTGSGSAPYAIAVGDLNNDTWIDIVVGNVYDSNIGIFINNGNGIFSDQITYSTGDGTAPAAVAISDLNGDGLLDIVVICYAVPDAIIGIFMGNPDGIFSDFIPQNIDVSIDLTSLGIYDFNNDNQSDIIVFNSYDDSLVVFLGDGSGSFATSISSWLSTLGSGFTVADFNKDGRLDVAVAHPAASSPLYSDVGVLLGNGDGTFANEVTFSTGYYPRTQSVAAGDINADGYLDLVVANPWSQTVGILFGYGNGTFSPQKVYSSGLDSVPQIVVVGDFNNDSQTDILTDYKKMNGINVLLGFGNGSFANQVIYSTSTQEPPNSFVIGDFNNDKLLDITVVNTKDNNIGVLLGFANANFMRGPTLSTGSSSGPRCVVSSDFNKDGRLDLAIANYITNDIGVLAGDGNGNFPRQMLYSTGSISAPDFVTVDDFNNDNSLDIVVSNSGTDTLGIFFGYGNGSFGSQVMYSVADGANPRSIASGDFNKDNRSDVVTASYGQDNVNVLLTYDSGRFVTQPSLSTGIGSQPQYIAVGDVNNDRRLDIIVVNNLYHNFGIFFGNGDGTFSTQKMYYGTNTFLPVVVDVGDFNKDSQLDLVILDNANAQMFIFLGKGNGNFSNPTIYGTGSNSWPGSIAVDDLNNDTRLDIIVGNFPTNTVVVFLGMGNGTFSQKKTYSVSNGVGLGRLAIDDFNNDGFRDVVVVIPNNNIIGILLGNGDGTLSNPIIIMTGDNSAPSSVVAADFDNDGRVDIVIAYRGTDSIAVLFGYGNATFQNPVIFSTGIGSQPGSLAVGDLNNDGQVDIVVVNLQYSNIGIFLSYTNRIFFSQRIYSAGNHAYPVYAVINDFNNDGRLDIAVCNQDGENIIIFLGYDEENLLSLPPYSTGLFSQPAYVTVADFNKDAQLDVAVANYGTSNLMILLGSGLGTFTTQIIYSTGNNSHPCWIACADLNNDTRLDLVVANGGNDNIGIFFGIGNGNFSGQLTYSTGLQSQPSSVIVGDFNNDALLDIAVANYGSNSVGVLFGYGNGSFANQIIISTGFNSRPYALASGDVNKDNVSDIIIANNGYGDTVVITKLC